MGETKLWFISNINIYSWIDFYRSKATYWFQLDKTNFLRIQHVMGLILDLRPQNSKQKKSLLGALVIALWKLTKTRHGTNYNTRSLVYDLSVIQHPPLFIFCSREHSYHNSCIPWGVQLILGAHDVAVLSSFGWVYL